jgi:hypothetical protein
MTTSDAELAALNAKATAAAAAQDATANDPNWFNAPKSNFGTSVGDVLTRIVPRDLLGHAPPERWKVRRDSTDKEVKFKPMSMKVALRLYRRARDFDRRTKRPGRHGGILGPEALHVLHVLLFDFLTYATGRLEPPYKAIATRANMAVSTVTEALKRLREARVISWVRRCSRSWRDGRHVLEQETNAYQVHPETEWPRYRAPVAPPPPARGTWGDPPRMPTAIERAATEAKGDVRAQVAALELGRHDALGMTPLERALAALGRAMPAKT